MLVSEAKASQCASPLVTIAIPTFNRASLLKACVASALSQTYSNVEVLVSNNASEDETQDVLNGFSDARLRVITQKENIGLLPNYNSCLENARGEYVVVVSDDDRIAPFMVDRCISLVREQPEINAVVALSDFYLASMGLTKPARVSRRLQTGILEGTDILLEYLRDDIGVVSTCSVLLRTSVLREQGGFPLHYPHAADVATWARLLLMGKAGLVNEACATVYCNGASETSRLRKEQLLQDGSRVASLITSFAEEYVGDAWRRQLIQAHSRRCFARRALVVISDFRNDGGRLREVAHLAWGVRRDLSKADVASLLGFTAIVLCPKILARRIHRMKQLVMDRAHAGGRHGVQAEGTRSPT